MRIRTLLAIGWIAIPRILAAQGPAAPLPLHPGGVYVTIRQPCPFAAAPPECPDVRELSSAWGGEAALVEVDGHRVPESRAQAALLLVGEIGSPVTVTYREQGHVRTVTLTRSDVYAPGPGFSSLLRTPHFAVHFRPEDEHRARVVANDAERAYARSGLPRATGERRAHLWVLREYPTHPPVQAQPSGWGAWVTGEYGPILEYGNVFTYVAYGAPGAAGARLGGNGWADANTLHRVAVAELLGNAAWLDGSLTNTGFSRSASLREYVRQRYGVERLGQIWRADVDLDSSTTRTLGITRARLEADWRRHIFGLGPNPAVGPTGSAIGMILLAGLLLILTGGLVARTREVD